MNSAASPDLIFHSGQVLTVDPAFSRAQALAVRGDRILAVGDDATVLALAGRDTVRVNLRGRTLLPGFVDAHAHLDREGLRSLVPSLDDARSIADIQAIIRREAARTPPESGSSSAPSANRPTTSIPPPPWPRAATPTVTISTPPRPTIPFTCAPPGATGATARRSWPSPTAERCNWRGSTATHRRRAAASRSSTTLAGEPTGRLLEHYQITVLELTLMRVVPRFTPELRVRALRESLRLCPPPGSPASTRATASRPRSRPLPPPPRARRVMGAHLPGARRRLGRRRGRRAHLRRLGATRL